MSDRKSNVEGIAESLPLKEAYRDVIQPAAKQLGQGLETVAKAINVALMPLEYAVWRGEQLREWLIPSLAERLRDVPEDRIVTPSAIVAGPALEALRFAAGEEELRDLYANLLATSMDRETAHKAHPAFVQILKQLSPDEARIIRLFVDANSYPIITIRAEMTDVTGGRDVLRHFSLVGEEAGCEYPELTPNYLDNLCRLGLAEIPETRQLAWFKRAGETLTGDEIYESLEASPSAQRVVSDIESLEDQRPNIVKLLIRRTDLGVQFLEACVVRSDYDSDS